MATQKKAWLSAIATFVLVAVIGLLFAFKPFHSNTNKSIVAGEKWFEYTNSTLDGNVNNPANYALTPNSGSLPPSCPTGTAQRCAVKATTSSSNPSQPNLSSIAEIKLRAVD